MSKESITIPVNLTVYEWHALLDELQFLLTVVRDNNNVKVLFQKITNQLHGEEVKIMQPKKDE